MENEVLGLRKNSESESVSVSVITKKKEEEDRERVWQIVMLSAMDERGPHVKFYPFFLLFCILFSRTIFTLSPIIIAIISKIIHLYNI